MCVDFNFCVIVEERSVCYIWNGVFLDMIIYGFDCGIDYIYCDFEENLYNYRMVI